MRMRAGFERVTEEREGSGDADRRCPPPGRGAGGGLTNTNHYGPGAVGRVNRGRARARALIPKSSEGPTSSDGPKSPEVDISQPTPLDAPEPETAPSFLKMTHPGWTFDAIPRSVQLAMAKGQSIKDVKMETPKVGSQQPSATVSSVTEEPKKVPDTSSNAYWEPDFNKRMPPKRLEIMETGRNAGGNRNAAGAVGGDLCNQTDTEEWDKPLVNKNALTSGMILGSPKIFFGIGKKFCEHDFQKKVCLCKQVQGEICVKCFTFKCNKLCKVGGPSLSNDDFKRMCSTSTHKAD